MEHLYYIAVGGTAALTITFMVLLARGRYLYWASRQVIRDVSRLYSAMQRVINNTHADRFIIVGLHNGGKVMRIHSKRYITIFEEFHSPNIVSIKGDYSRFQVGSQYVALINDLIERGVITGATQELEPGFLRDAYEKDGIRAFHLFYIGWMNGTHFFGSISTVSEASMESPQQYQEIRVCAEKVKQIMKGRRLF